LAFVTIGEGHWSVEIARRRVTVTHDAARHPAGQRGAVFFQAAAIIEASANRLIFARQRARIAPAKAWLQFAAAVQAVRQLFMAAAVAISASFATAAVIAATARVSRATGGSRIAAGGGRRVAAWRRSRCGSRSTRRRRRGWLCGIVVVVVAISIFRVCQPRVPVAHRKCRALICAAQRHVKLAR
jgi:hypothetical protein